MKKIISTKRIPVSWFFRRLRVFVKPFVILMLVFLVIVWATFFARDSSLTSRFMEIDSCPACYGERHCSDFRDHVRLRGWDSIFMQYPILNLKNVFYGDYVNIKQGRIRRNRRIVLKKLAHNVELQNANEKICKMVNTENQECNAPEAIQAVIKNQELLKVVKGLCDVTECPTRRLMEKISSPYKSYAVGTSSTDEAHLLTTLVINPEPVLLQAFPKSQGWPFPEYFGACGRVIAEEYVGKQLHHYHDDPWFTRVNLAWQIMKIANDLTNKDEDFALYWTDLNYDNLAVQEDGTLVIVDAEDIVVVDKTEIKNSKPDNWNVSAQSKFDDCERNCLTFRVDLMCSRLYVDHNYYAACRNLISPYAQLPGYDGGLLHDIPKYVSDKWPLERLLRECAKPEKTSTRMEVVKKLMDTLGQLRTLTEE